MKQKIIITPSEETEDLLPGYLERRRAEALAMDQALGKSDYAALITFGHNVKGTAGSYGMPILGDLAEKVHTAAVEKNKSACRQALSDYQDYLSRVELG